jgi:acetylornithine deacetylase
MAGESFTPRRLIERLVGFDTVSAKSNLDLIDFVERYLAGHGVASRRSYDAGREKANLFATLGPERPGGVVLSGHTDVVPVEGQPWDGDPFAVTERDGRLYGRGTADMKSFLAAALALVPEALAAGLRKPLHLALSYDEEVGCFGAEVMIADIKANLPPPAIVIIGEPTSMRLVNAHKGGAGFETRITGKEAHSSQPHRAASAITAAAELIGLIMEMAEEKRRDGPRAGRFEPPYTTFNVGTIEGGSALNIVPRHAGFTWEFRTVPGDDGEVILARFNRFAEEQVLPRLRRTAPEAAIETETLSWVPGLRPETDSPAEDLVRFLTGSNRTEVVSYATEGGLFQEAGMSTVVCGPGSIDQAHRPNEFIEVAQVDDCTAFLRNLIAWAAGG